MEHTCACGSIERFRAAILSRPYEGACQGYCQQTKELLEGALEPSLLTLLRLDEARKCTRVLLVCHRYICGSSVPYTENLG